MGVVKLSFLLVLYTAIPTFILLCTPGLPPQMKFEAYNITSPLKLEGKLAKNSKLDRAELLVDGEFVGPESIAIRGDEVYTGVIGGQILRIKNGKWEKVVQTGKECAGLWDHEHCGRPLGLRFDHSGKLLVADASLGLLRVDVDKKTVETLLPRFSKIDGSDALLNFADDVDVTSKDGTIYMTDAGQHGTFASFLIDMIGEPTGRLIKFNPTTKKTEVLASGIRFANGVQLSKKEDFIAISETGLGRILKYHLTGPKAGKTEVLVDGLPGYPDNIRSNGKGGFYVALIASRSHEKTSHIDQFAGIPWARKLLVRFTTILEKGLVTLNSYAPHEYIGRAIAYVKHFGPIGDISAFPSNVIIVEIDENGNILGSLQNQDGKISYISEIDVGDKYAYFGSPFTAQLWRIKTEYL